MDCTCAAARCAGSCENGVAPDPAAVACICSLAARCAGSCTVFVPPLPPGEFGSGGVPVTVIDGANSPGDISRIPNPGFCFTNSLTSVAFMAN